MNNTIAGTPFLQPSNRMATHVGQTSLTGHTSGRYMVNASMGKSLRETLDAWVGSFDDLHAVIRDHKVRRPNELAVCYAVYDRNSNQYVMELHGFPTGDMPIETAVANLTEIGRELVNLGGSYCAVDHTAHALCVILTQYWHDSQNQNATRPLKSSVINSIGSLFSNVDTLVVIGQQYKTAFAFNGLSEFIIADDKLIVNAPVVAIDKETE